MLWLVSDAGIGYDCVDSVYGRKGGIPVAVTLLTLCRTCDNDGGCALLEEGLVVDSIGVIK